MLEDCANCEVVRAAHAARRSKSLSGKPLAPASGERGWGEGVWFFFRGIAPSPPTPLPRVQGRGELIGRTLSGDFLVREASILYNLHRSHMTVQDVLGSRNGPSTLRGS